MGSVLNWLNDAVERVRGFAYSEPQPRLRRPRIGLALSGGFARGIAHLGVLKVLSENGIPIDCIAGTSVGALIAAAYASGVSLEEMERQARNTHFKDFGRWTVSWMGLATNKRLEGYLQRFSPAKDFAELHTPLAITATDLCTGEPVYFTSGQLGAALRASCAYPGLFLPVEHQGRTLVDGFLAAPVPVEGTKKLGAERIIAVYLEAGSDEVPRNFAGVISRSFSIIQHYAHLDWRSKADVVIEPNVRKFIWDDFGRTGELIAAGEAATRAVLPKLRALVSTPIPVSAPAGSYRSSHRRGRPERTDS